MKFQYLIGIGFIGLSLLLTACNDQQDMAVKAEMPSSENRVGGDRDAHGCIGSAGYQWCESLGSCIRPWELAKQEGLDNTPEVISQFCKPTPK